MLPAAPALSMLCLQTSPSIFYEYKVPFLAPWLEKRLSSKRFRRQRKSCFIFYFIFRAKCPDSSTSRWPLFLGLHPAQLGAFWCLCRAQAACSTHRLPRLEGETTSHAVAASPGCRNSDLELSLFNCCLPQLSFLQRSFFKALQKGKMWLKYKNWPQPLLPSWQKR